MRTSTGRYIDVFNDKINAVQSRPKHVPGAAKVIDLKEGVR